MQAKKNYCWDEHLSLCVCCRVSSESEGVWVWDQRLSRTKSIGIKDKRKSPKKPFMGLHRIFSEKCRNMYVVFFFLVDPLHCYCCCRRRNDLLCLLLFTLQECSNQHILWESDFLLVFFLPLPFHFCSVLFGSLWLRALFSLNRIRVQHMAQRI